MFYRPFYLWLITVALILFADSAVVYFLSLSPSLTPFIKGLITIAAPPVIISPFIYFLSAGFKKMENRMRLFSIASENSNEAICITDARANIEHVNSAFCSTTGYSKEEVAGKNPRIMKSGRHDAEFYKKMWETLNETGHWQGEVWDRRKNGEIYPKWLSISAFEDKKGNLLNYIGVFSDMTMSKQTEENLEYLTHYDNLTGLPNRVLLRDRLKQAIHHADRYNHLVGVFFMDIDQFRNINDTLGHLAGDQLLKELSQRLLKCVRQGDTIARLGGDEFAVVLSELRNEQDAESTAREIIEALSVNFVLKGHYDVFINISIGVTLYPFDGKEVEDLLRNADMAMYLAKEPGNKKIQLYNREIRNKSFERLSIETNLRMALEKEEFVLYYQPIADLSTGQILGSEALIRRQESGWLAPPSSFIKLAEKTGLIIPICEWTLNKACRLTKTWQEEGLPPLRISVNVTATQFHQQKLIHTVKNALKETGLDPKYLELELTERVIIHDTNASIKMMHELKEMGVRLSIDDFGTGYSSLSYLKKFPIDKLKIDISFVKDIPSDPDSASIAKAIITLAHTLNLRVIAEGVENERQLSFLKEHGCDEIQGYYFCVPLPPESLKQLILGGKKLEA